MKNTRLIRHLSTAVIVLLSAAVVLAGTRISTRLSRQPAEETSLALSLKFLDPDPNAIPFPVSDDGPAPPTLPAAAPEPAARSAAPSGLTAAHKAAVQTEGDPASFHWALIVGINDYAGKTRDNIGSYQDALILKELLLAHGWRADHVVLVGNRAATLPNVREGLKWLASKTDGRSTVVVHYSGHEKPYRTDIDRDGESRDVGLWLSDNNLMSDNEWGRGLGAVASSRMWINMAVCRAGGFDDPGTKKPGRLITYSSPESQLSYEDPNVNFSVFGYNVLVRGFKMRLGDLDDDGVITVQEAFHYGRPMVLDRTGNRQRPVMEDMLGSGFSLAIAGV